MFLPPTAWSSELLADSYGEYLVAGLLADPLLKTTAAPVFDRAQTTLRQSNGVERDAYRRAQRAMAVRDRADYDRDLALRKFELAVQDAVGKNRNHPDYKRYFPSGLTAVVGAPMAAEQTYAGNRRLIEGFFRPSSARSDQQAGLASETPAQDATPPAPAPSR